MAAGATTKAKRGYTRETVKLTKAHVTRAERLLLDGKVPGRGMEWGDTEERGLTHATQDGLDRIGETVQRSCDANVKGPAIVLGALIPLMQTTSSRPAVVTIGSVAGLIPAPTRAVYCASKSAQHLLVRSVDLECEAQAATPAPGQPRRARVHFLLVAPGPIKNSFVATYSVDASTGPRDRRDQALRVEDVVRATLRRVDAELADAHYAEHVERGRSLRLSHGENSSPQ